MTWVDRVILAMALLLVAALYGFLWRPGDRGSEATVWVNGQQLDTLPLARDRILKVHGPLGESIIEVRDGRVRVVDSPGRRKICVRAGWLADSGETAICLPNRVVVRVEGGPPQFDGINF